MMRAKNSIRGRLIAISAVTSSLALLLACSAFVTYELITFRQSLVNDLTTDANVLTFNVTAPILFGDPEAATASLAALKAKPRIRSATITTADGKVFAGYGHHVSGSSSARGDSEGGLNYRFDADRVFLSVPVLSDGSRIGSLTLESDLDEHARRIRRYLLLTGLILVVSLIAAVGISVWLQRRILQPIGRLTDAARLVVHNHNFSVRVEAPGEDELALLTNTFNNMLGQIEHQNRELKQAVEMRDEFLTMAAHELRTPLTPLQLQVHTMMRHAAKEHADGFVPRIKTLGRLVERVAKLVEDLLDISRLNTRALELHHEPVDLVAVSKEVIATYQDEASHAGCQLKLSAAEPVIGIWDRSRLEQVLSNLISNALKYGPGMPVELRVEARGNEGIFVIQDRGMGIRSEDLPRIFGRFERGVSSRHYGGFGLGLWIVREILTSLGGTIEVKSKPGEGATFTVRLPLGPESLIAGENGRLARSDPTQQATPPYS